MQYVIYEFVSYLSLCQMNSWKKKSSNASNASNFWQTRYLFHNGTKKFLKLHSFPFFSKILRDIFSFSYLIKSDCLFMSQAVYCVFVLDTPASTIKLSAMLPHQRCKHMSQPLNSNKSCKNVELLWKIQMRLYKIFDPNVYLKNKYYVAIIATLSKGLRKIYKQNLLTLVCRINVAAAHLFILKKYHPHLYFH